MFNKNKPPTVSGNSNPYNGPYRNSNNTDTSTRKLMREIGILTELSSLLTAEKDINSILNKIESINKDLKNTLIVNNTTKRNVEESARLPVQTNFIGQNNLSPQELYHLNKRPRPNPDEQENKRNKNIDSDSLGTKVQAYLDTNWLRMSDTSVKIKIAEAVKKLNSQEFNNLFKGGFNFCVDRLCQCDKIYQKIQKFCTVGRELKHMCVYCLSTMKCTNYNNHDKSIMHLTILDFFNKNEEEFKLTIFNKLTMGNNKSLPNKNDEVVEIVSRPPETNNQHISLQNDITTLSKFSVFIPNQEEKNNDLFVHDNLIEKNPIVDILQPLVNVQPLEKPAEQDLENKQEAVNSSDSLSQEDIEWLQLYDWNKFSP